MPSLEDDLRYFENELANERDQFRRNLIMSQIRDIKQQQLNVLIMKRKRLEKQNKNLEEALEWAKKNPKNPKKF
jgi:hypothetical protein